MVRKITKTFFVIALSLFMSASAFVFSSEANVGQGTSTKNPKKPKRNEAQFVGADRCSGCHTNTHAGWSETAHTQKLRDGSLEGNYMNDGSLTDRSDYFDGGEVDIRTLPGGSKFDAFGDNAPILGSDGGGAYIKIGAAKYYILFTLGGSAIQSRSEADANDDGTILNDEAQWKQRYITMIGKSNYILPVQFNAKNQQYTTYHPEDWYDDANLPKEIGKNRSYERRCAGCHVTGLQVGLDEGEWVMSFSDISVACEACHGPGSQHAASPSKENIVNPGTMTTDMDLNGDSSVDQVDTLMVRNFVCYQCHSRGAGKFSAGGTTLAYPSREDVSGRIELYRPGMDWREFYDISTKRNDYWGGDPTSGDFITSKGHHQQQQDHAFGPHGADRPWDHACHECHSMHKADKEHLVLAEIVEDGIPVDNGSASTNNPLCLACHSGHGDFADLTPQDINTNTGVDEAIQDHTKNRAYMDVPFTNNCSECHMPDTAKSALEGDIKSHVFNIIWPNYVQQSGTFSWSGFQKWWESNESFVDPGDGTDPFASIGPIPNSCMTSGCHVPGADDDIVTQWYGSGHADGFGEPFNHWNADGAVSSRCVRCHTMGGFTQLINGEELTAQSVIFPKVLGCETCHEPNGGGQTVYEAGKVQEVMFPSGDIQSLGDSSNICMTCHQGRESGASIDEEIAENPGGPHTFINRHYYAAAAILFGDGVNAGYEYDGKTYLGQNTYPGHGGGLDTCVKCHMRGVEDHNFLPELGDCSGCHSGITDFEELGRPFGLPNIDYDGDGTGESFQGEIDGLEAALLAEIQTYAANVIGDWIIYQAGAYPYFFNDTNENGTVDPGEAIFPNRYTTFDDALLKAAFNYHSNQDPCGDIHNHKYVIQTIIDSIEDLGGNVGGFIRP